MTHSLEWLLALALCTGCGSSGSNTGPATGGSGGVSGSGGNAGLGGAGAAGSGASAGTSTGGASGSGGSAGVAGAATVSCFDSKSGPTLIVVQAAAGASGKAETVLRVPLQLSGPATGLSLESVEQRDGKDQVVRTWQASDFAGPPGFDGSVVADTSNQYGVVLSAKAASLQVETDACALDAFQRSGKVVVTGKTNEAGPFQVECGLGQGLGGKGPEALRFACAKGVPGWLYGQTSIVNVQQPVTAALADSSIHIANRSSADLSGFSANGATLHAYFADNFFPPCTSPPDSWDFPTTGKHDLWKGQSSNDLWSGPAPAGAEATANWMWQLTGAQFPSGVCFKPSTSPPEPGKECMNPVLQVVVSGNSSAGSWQWESDLFQCYDLTGM